MRIRPFLSLPADSDSSPSIAERISVFLIAFIPWMLVYETFIIIGPAENAVSTNFAFEEHLPVWEFSVVFYSFAFIFSLAVPFVIKSSRHLRNFITDIWVTSVFEGIAFLIFPLVVEQRSFIPDSFLGQLILAERSLDGVSAALPSGHVIWAFLSAAYFSRSYKKYKILWYTFAVLISISCFMTGAHSIPDVLTGYLAFLIIYYRREIWSFILSRVRAAA